MSRASSKLRHFAKRLTVYERGASKITDQKTPPAFQVCEKLRAHLVTLLGNAGFRELLACALPRAQAEIPWLGAVHLKADGALEGLEELSAKHSEGELFEGGIVLLAQLLGLLVAFIGEDLTLRFVSEVWSDVPLGDLAFGRGVMNENKK